MHCRTLNSAHGPRSRSRHSATCARNRSRYMHRRHCRKPAGLRPEQFPAKVRRGFACRIAEKQKDGCRGDWKKTGFHFSVRCLGRPGIAAGFVLAFALAPVGHHKLLDLARPFFLAKTGADRRRFLRRRSLTRCPPPGQQSRQGCRLRRRCVPCRASASYPERGLPPLPGTARATAPSLRGADIFVKACIWRAATACRAAQGSCRRDRKWRRPHSAGTSAGRAIRLPRAPRPRRRSCRNDR